MVMVTLGEAAELTGYSKTAIRAAIVKNRIRKALRTDDGSYQIDREELLEQFTPIDGSHLKLKVKTSPQVIEIVKLKTKVEMLEAQVAQNQKLISDQSAGLDRLAATKDAVILEQVAKVRELDGAVSEAKLEIQRAQDKADKLAGELAAANDAIATQRAEEARKAKEATEQTNKLKNSLADKEKLLRAYAAQGFWARLTGKLPKSQPTTVKAG